MRRGKDRLVAAITAGLVLTAGGGAAAVGVVGFDPFGTAQVGQTANGATLLPDNQWVSPVGRRIEVTNGRIISSALSPDGTKLAALTSNRLLGGFLTIFDLRTQKVIQQLGISADGYVGQVGDGTVAADGPLYSADGHTLWMPQSKDLLRFAVNQDGTVSSQPVATIKLAGHHGPGPTPAPALSGPNGDALPSGLALSADGNDLYVALNGNDSVGIIDTATNTLKTEIPVGVAPRQIAYRWPYLYVSDEGGRHPHPGDFINYTAYSQVPADHETGGTTTGAVSIVDLRTQRETREIPVGLQPTALLLNRRALFVANSNDDSFSLIDTETGRLARTVRVQPLRGVLVGSHVNAIAVPDSHHLLVSLGRDNAIAEYSYTGLRKPIRLLGLIPTDWYPVAVRTSRALGGSVIVTNGKGVGARGLVGDPTVAGLSVPGAHLTYEETSSVTSFPLPTDPARLNADTAQVFKNNSWDSYNAVNSGTGDTVPAVIPPRRGLPSVIKHVFLIIRENRTYDQVLGDLGSGNGDPALAQFGVAVTPNDHALARQFGDLDNFYDEGTLSADGHNWIVQADANDYIESSFGSFARSYPASGGDALAYQRDGFLWDRALKAGLSVRNYGEYDNWISTPASGGPTWGDWYKDSQILEGKTSGPLPVPIDRYRSWTDVPALNAVTNPYFPEFDLDIPDQYRVDIWERDFRQQQVTDSFPALTVMTIMSDHTSVPPDAGGPPNPVAEVADNDLALGRIVDDISHSKFWRSTAMFVDEDDAQNGLDHVDGHRSPMFVISPYSRPGTDSYYYSQINLTRTIEQILGLEPLNQGDANAVPMYNAFTSTPDLTPYTVQPNLVPLTLGSTSAPTVGLAPLAQTAATRRWNWLLNVPASERRVYSAWAAWGRHQHFGGAHPLADFADPALLNRYDWYAAHAWRVPYPGDTKIYAPSEVSTALAAEGRAGTD